MKIDLNLKEEYKETELGLVPEEWEVVRLGEIVRFVRGISWSKKDENPNGVPVIAIPNVREGKVSCNIRYWIVKNISKAKQLNEGDILLVGSSGSVHNVGRIAVVQNLPFKQATFASFLVKVIPSGIIDERYLFYLLQSNVVDFAKCSKRAADGKFNLQLMQLSEFKIPLPPLSEQKKIAYVLSAVQEAKEKTEDVIKATKELKKSMMKHLFTYGPVNLEEAERVTLKETEIGLIPEEWEMNTFGNVGTFQYGYTESGNEKEVGPKFLRITDINLDTNIINWASVPYCKIEEDRFANYSLNEGDILIARIGATTGKTCIIKNPPKSVFASYLIRFIVNRDIIDPNFLFYYTQDYRYWRQINAGKEGKLKKGVSSSQLKKFLLPVPSLLTQKKIASILWAIDQKIEVEESKKKALEDLFKSLLHNLMTAKIRVNHLEKILDE